MLALQHDLQVSAAILCLCFMNFSIILTLENTFQRIQTVRAQWLRRTHIALLCLLPLTAFKTSRRKYWVTNLYSTYNSERRKCLGEEEHAVVFKLCDTVDYSQSAFQMSIPVFRFCIKQKKVCITVWKIPHFKKIPLVGFMNLSLIKRYEHGIE